MGLWLRSMMMLLRELLDATIELLQVVPDKSLRHLQRFLDFAPAFLSGFLPQLEILVA